MVPSFFVHLASAAEGNPEGTLCYVGTYTGAKSKGIYAYRFDKKGGLTSLGLAAETVNPTFLALHPNRKFLYAANEIGNFGPKKNCGAVSAFAIDPDSGKLTFLNQQSSGGNGPCHVAVDKTGQALLVANYGGGSIASLPIGKDGDLGAAATFIQHQGSSINKQRQEGPHAHFITTDPGNKFVLSCDLGLDKVLMYDLDPGHATLKAHEPPFTTVSPGSGPRHLAFHPDGKFAYLINEMGSTITAFSWQGKSGKLKEIQTITTLPPDFTGSSTTAEVVFHPSGRFLYGSNRGHDSIVAYAVAPKSGKLTLVGHFPCGGKTPRHFAVDPTGHFLLAENQSTDNVVVFAIDQESGNLTSTGTTAEVGAPVCLVFVR